MASFRLRLALLFLTFFAAMLFMLDRVLYRRAEDIQVNWNARWENDNNAIAHQDEEAAVRFSIAFEDANLPELTRKLDDFLAKHASLSKSDQSMKDDYSMGLPLANLRDMVDHWRNKYDWKQRSSRLNALGPQYLAQVNGLRIHYFDIRSLNSSAIPLLLLHGWPGSFTEFVDIIPLLTKRFHLIVPSLPGFGFSQAPSSPKVSFTFLDSAVIFAKLMKRVHPSSKYVCQGGDYGSFICSSLGQIDVDRLLGIHINMAVIAVPPWSAGSMLSWGFLYLFPSLLSQGNRERIGPNVIEMQLRMLHETGYFHLQGTKPETIGAGLEDSPVFLLAWIGEKFRSFSGEPDYEMITMDEILDDVMVYWQTRSATTAARWYYHMARSLSGALTSLLAPVKAKTAILDAPHEIFRPPTFWLKPHRYPNLQRFKETPRGGHFFAMEFPSILAEDIIEYTEYLISTA